MLKNHSNLTRRKAKHIRDKIKKFKRKSKLKKVSLFVDGEAGGDSQDSSDEDADSDSDDLADFKDDSSQIGFATEEMKQKFIQDLRQRELEQFE